jgi:hypothetical protein
VFGATVDKKMQIVWAAPLVKSMTMLERVQNLIAPMIRYHFNDIVARSRGYRGYRRTVANIPKASWHWQVNVPCPIGGTTKEDFLFIAGEGYFRAMPWRSVNPIYGCSIAGGIPREGRMYVGRRSSTAMLCST